MSNYIMMTYDLNNTNWENIKNRVPKYLQIIQLVKTSNVQTNEEFQRIFNGFYRIRQRPKKFYGALYDYLEHNKNNKEISFEQTLTFFYQKFQRFEPSFSSKIVATINPNFPVWDTEVLARLNLKKPNNLDRKIRFERMVKTYDDIVSWYSEFLNTEQSKNMIKTFDEKIGTLNITDNITDIKKVDLILWQTRPM